MSPKALRLIGWIILAEALIALLAVRAFAADVSSRPVIAQDLQLAAQYWGQAPCASVQVLVGPMTAATGNNGVVIPASEVAAETALESCTITLAPQTFRDRHRFPRFTCELIVHEYGHLLGLPDSSSVPMMNANGAQNRSPVCA